MVKVLDITKTSCIILTMILVALKCLTAQPYNWWVALSPALIYYGGIFLLKFFLTYQVGRSVVGGMVRGINESEDIQDVTFKHKLGMFDDADNYEVVEIKGPEDLGYLNELTDEQKDNLLNQLKTLVSNIEEATSSEDEGID